MYNEIKEIASFLNIQNGNDVGEMTAQMLKLSEEVGEASSAWIGYIGQNPRKGVTHNKTDVVNELIDVAITALVGIARLGEDPNEAMNYKLNVIMERYEAIKSA